MLVVAHFMKRDLSWMNKTYVIFLPINVHPSFQIKIRLKQRPDPTFWKVLLMETKQRRWFRSLNMLVVRVSWSLLFSDYVKHIAILHLIFNNFSGRRITHIHVVSIHKKTITGSYTYPIGKIDKMRLIRRYSKSSPSLRILRNIQSQLTDLSSHHSDPSSPWSWDIKSVAGVLFYMSRDHFLADGTSNAMWMR